MNLYHLSQTVVSGYDTYDSAVVAAETEEAARLIHPYYAKGFAWNGKDETYTWPNASQVTVRLIGAAADDIVAGVICASFNAG